MSPSVVFESCSQRKEIQFISTIWAFSLEALHLDNVTQFAACESWGGCAYVESQKSLGDWRK